MMEHELRTEAGEPSQDVTLGLAALIGIFLAVVLICAVFFGFGYSTGRTLHAAGAPAAAPPPAAPPTAVPAAETQLASTPASTLTPKPSAAVALEDTAEQTAASDVTASGEGHTAPQVHSSREALSATPAEVPAPTAREQSAPPSASAGIMVQIAAVVHPNDAEALAASLRRNGYKARVRTEPQDKFLHVQVGPFATANEARSMRARLQADGYNAFMKP